jgi:hypothetical protein
MNLYLYRRVKEPTYTVGHIYDGIQRLCNTLEDPVRELVDYNGDGDFDDPGEGKIYGQTAIPAGEYELKMKMSPTFKRPMPYLQSVKGFTSVMIHPLTDATQTRGCIGVGECRIKGRLINSRAWSDILNKRLTEAEERGERNFIRISED